MWLRHHEAAEYIGLSVWTLAHMRVRGDGPPFYRLGLRLIGYRKDDLDQWLAARRCRSTRDLRPRPGDPANLEHSLDEVLP
jgi:predicted DNA-binding transcriptional regulator AlpA